MTIETQRFHGTCVAFAGLAPALGVLLVGPSGCGKSDLALRLIDDGWNLVADDQVLVAAGAAGPVARSPAETFGLLEVRGIGLVAPGAVASARLLMIVRLDPSRAVTRLPEPTWETVCGKRLPALTLRPFEASTPAKIRLAAKLLTIPLAEGVTFPFGAG